MKTTRRILLLVLVLSTLSVLSPLPASAATVTFGGTLDTGDPTMPVVFISTPNCTGQGVSPVFYEVTSFAVDANGTYTLDMTDALGLASMYLYEGNFDPTNGLANCVAADNGGTIQFSYGLTAGTIYYVVVFHDGFDNSVLPYGYSVTIDGPGEVCLGGVCGSEEAAAVPGCDTRINIPSTAVGAKFTSDALIYAEPGVATSPAVTLVAGKNVRALGLNATGEYYKILFECDFLWVKANTLGPNPESPWNGAPLPTGTVN